MERLRAPLSVSIWVTGKCNLNCTYCYSYPSKAPHLPANVLVNLTQEFDSMRVFEIQLGGGEPFLHPEIFNILDRIFAFRNSIILLSNGTLLSRDKCERLSAYMEYGKFLDLQISLDSHLPEVNDRVRGGTKKAIEAIECLAELKLNPQIAVVVHRENVDVALDVIEYFYPRVKRFHFMNLMASRKFYLNVEEGKDLSLDQEVREEFWRALTEKVGSMSPDISVSGAHSEEFLSMSPSWSWPGCLAGVTRCDIDSDLNVVACNIAGEAILGNLHDKSFEDVWLSHRAQCIAKIPYPLCSPEGRVMTVDCISNFNHIRK